MNPHADRPQAGTVHSSAGAALAGALEGLRVLDLTQMLAGPFCAQLMADHGAEVIKVESPEGDMTRAFGPYCDDDQVRNMGGYYQSVNRNKKGVVIDLKSEQGRQVLLSLVDKSDVLIENFRAGVLDRLGLSYEKLAERNPRLVYACIRGFGDPRSASNDYTDWPAFDVVSQSMGGMMGVTGAEDGVPMKVGPGVGDLIPATLCAFGVLAAVMRAQRTGRGQFIDVAMVDGVLAFCERVIYQYSISGVIPRPQGSHHPMFVPMGVFPAADGWVTVGSPNDGFWIKLCKLMGRPELAEDPRFRSNDDRVRNAPALKAELGAFTSAHTKEQLRQLLGGQLPFGPIYDAQDIFTDPYFAAREMLVEVEQPHSSKKLTIAGVPIKMSETPGSVRTRAPMLGEHTREVLLAAGMTAAQVDELTASGAVRCAA
jgi:crotonobetainyl-CoA:carnitine CoA-transferase CaiB-like acyl-CoA transferase